MSSDHDRLLRHAAIRLACDLWNRIPRDDLPPGLTVYHLLSDLVRRPGTPQRKYQILARVRRAVVRVLRECASCVTLDGQAVVVVFPHGSAAPPSLPMLGRALGLHHTSCLYMLRYRAQDPFEELCRPQHTTTFRLGDSDDATREHSAAQLEDAEPDNTGRPTHADSRAERVG